MLTPGDGRRKVTVLTTKPADLEAVTATEANAGIDIHWHIRKSDYQLAPTGSTTHNDTPLGAKGQHTHFAQSQASGNVTPYRDLDPATGRPLTDSDTETVFALFKEKDTELVIMDRLGPDPDEDWAEGDEYSIYVVRPDDMQESTEDGFIAYPTPLAVGDFYRFRTIAAGV